MEEKELNVTSTQDLTKKRKRFKNKSVEGGGQNEKVKKSTKLKKFDFTEDKYLDTMAEESEDEYNDRDSYEDSEEDDLEEDIGTAIPDEMKDFITEEVEDEVVEEDVSDVEYEPDKLDEEDLELIAENTGSKWKTKDEDEDEDRGKQLRRLKKGMKKSTQDDDEDLWYEDEPSRAFELSDVWATVIECFGEVDLVIQILKNERNVQASQQQQLQDEEDDEQIVSDYEQEQSQKADDNTASWDNYADPDELVREYMTKEDNEIRMTDQPERLFIRYKNRTAMTSGRDIRAESQWMTKRLLTEFNRDLTKENIQKSYEEVFKGSYPYPNVSPSQDVSEKCEIVLNWLFNERWEVPFILYHKRHLICPPLTDAIVWRIYQLDNEWLRLRNLSNELQNSIERIGHEELPSDVIYYSMYFDSMEDLIDVSNHLNYHFHIILNPPQLKPIQLDEALKLDDDLDEDVEDDIFGDFVPIDEHITDPVHNKSPPSSPENVNDVDDTLESLTNESVDSIEDLPANITASVPTSVDASSNSLPVNGIATPGDRGGEKGSDGSSIMGMMEDGSKDMLDVTSGGLPAADLREAKGEVNKGADGRTTSIAMPNGREEVITSDVTLSGKNGKASGVVPSSRSSEMDEDIDYIVEEDKLDVIDSQSIPIDEGKKLFKRRNAMMHLIESCEQYGLHEVWSGYVPTANQFYTVLEKSIVQGSADLKVQLNEVREAWNSLGITGIMATPVVEGNVEQQIEDICTQYCIGPFNTGRRVYKTLVDYHAKKLANHISIKRLLREYYRNYCSITCITTPKGELDVDASHSSWLCRRLFRFPLIKMTSFDQLSYDYPKDLKDRGDRLKYLEDKMEKTRFVELYLELMDLEKNGAIDIIIHPLNGIELPPWKDDKYKMRFSDWYDRFKQLVLSGKQLISDVQRDQLEQQKSLLEKEEELLNEVEEMDRQWRRNLLDQLSLVYCPSNISSQSIWKHVQRSILDRLINIEIIPKFKKEVCEMLLKNAQRSVIIHSQRMLQYKLDVYPNYKTILSLVHDTPSDGLKVYSCIINEYGELLDYKIFESLLSVTFNTKSAGYTSLPNFQQMMYDLDIILELIRKYNITTILVGLVSIYSLDLFSRYKKIGCEVPRLMATINGRSNDIIHWNRNTNDKTSNLVMNNKESIMCLSLGRWYLDALAETINLWSGHDENVLLRLNLHPLQHLIPIERFSSALEIVLINAVCDAGVDINRIKRCPNYHKQLQFIAGLGPRKSNEFIRLLKFSNIINRGQIRIIKEDVIGNCVFTNCSSFIKFNSSDTNDLLDTTRIHPIESSFIAEKLCSGSLDDEVTGDDAIQEILTNPNKLDDLDLEAYSLLLYERQDMPRMLPYLLFVKEELQTPYKDSRCKFKNLKDDDIFFQVLQINKNELKYGTHVLCKFDDIYEKFVKATILPYNLRAQVSDFYQYKSDLQKSIKDNKINLKGETINARIIKLDFIPFIENGRSNFKIEISLTNHQRKYILNNYLNELINQNLETYTSPLTKFDVNYPKKPLFNEKKKIQYRRAIRHPCYRMWPIHKTVNFLKQTEIPVGECCICPMSECDRLSLVIKTCIDPFNCATFVIHERNQRIPGELGKDLYIQKERFSNLDQIIAQFCETLKLNLEEFYMHPKYRQSADFAKVERDLIQENALKPDSITWAILPPNPRRKDSNNETINNPLRFTLMVIPPGFSMISHDCKSLQDPIYVDHKSFRLWTHTEKSLRDLIAWWKSYGYWHRNAERQKYLDEKRKFMDEYSRRQHTQDELY